MNGQRACGRALGLLAALPLFWASEAPAQDPQLIRSLVVSKKSVCAGEEIDVDVKTKAPQGASAWVNVAIGGYPGSRRVLRFEGRPGPRLIHVSASTDKGLVESRTEKIEVKDCQATPRPAVRARFNPYRPFTADFTVVNAKPPRTGSYRWNFGDGTSQVTSVPYASHFYGARLDGTRPYQTFTVTVAGPPGGTGRYTVTLQDNYYHLKRQGIVQPRVSADRTLRLSGGKLVGSYTIRNLEAEPLVFDRAVAEFQYCDTSRRSSYASLAPNAPELPSVPSTPAVPATPTVPSGPTVPAAPGRSVTPGVASGVTAAPPVLATSPTPALTATTGTTIPTVAGTGVRVNAKALQHRTVTLDPAGIPNGVCGVGHHLAGRTSSGTRAYASVYFEIRPQPPLAQHRHDPQLKQLLLDLRARGLLRDETQVSYDELYRLEQEGKIRQTETGWERTDVNQ